MNLEENAPASWGVDLTCEAELLERYDVDALAIRIEDTIASRAFTRAAMTGAAVALALAGAAALSLSAYASEPTPPSPVADMVQCPPCPYASESEEEAEEPPVTIGEPAPPTRAPRAAKEKKVDEEPVVVEDDEKSRLRAQLDLYDRATQALAGGDHEDAIELAYALRTDYGDGPLAIEAGIVEVKGLLRLGAQDSARALIKTLRADARAAPRVDELRALALELPWPPVIDEPREEPIEVDGPDLDARELVRRKLTRDAIIDPAESAP